MEGREEGTERWLVGRPSAGCPLPSFLYYSERATDGAGKNSVTEMEERKLMTKRAGGREGGRKGGRKKRRRSLIDQRGTKGSPALLPLPPHQGPDRARRKEGGLRVG